MPKAVLIEDQSLLQQVEQIQLGRRDKTPTKTIKDLLRERITELRLNGDPAKVETEADEPAAA